MTSSLPEPGTDASAEPPADLARGSAEPREHILGLTSRLFTIATVALIAIAGTIAGLYVVHERTSDWVSESRAVARLARTAYGQAMERELGLNETPNPDRLGALREHEVAEGFRLTLDTLTQTATSGTGMSQLRRDRIAGIKLAAEAWQRAIPEWRDGYLDSAAVTPAATRIRRIRFDVLRARLALLVNTEDALYVERQDRERAIRFLASAAALVEILVLLIVIGRLRGSILSQARQMVQQKEALQRQAGELELSNRDLAEAIKEKEAARALAEEQAAEEAALFTAITEIFFILDREGRYHKIAPANDELLAGPREELLGRTVSEVLPPHVATLALESIAKALETRQRVDVEYPLELQGRTVWFAGTVTPLGEDRVLWVARDVSETRRAAEAIRESEVRFRNLVEHSPQSVALHADGRILYANPACAALLGFAEAESLLGAPLLRFVAPDSAPRLVDSIGSLGRTPTRAVTCECEFRRSSDARMLAVEVTSVPVTYTGRPSVLSILHDVTERRQLEDQLAHQAFHDPLTNLANRVLFRDRVEHGLQRAARGGRTPAVLFIDLDNFKAVNDGLGHSAGDWLLIEVATRLSSCLRPADTVARLGGDEFAVLLDDEAANPSEVADRILSAFHVPFSVQGTDIVVTMSIGIAALMPHQGADDVLRNADLALYRAKAEGKARSASFEPEMHVAALRRLEMETELRRAIERERGAGRLVIHYQPIARLSTGRMFGFEALVRWEHPERGVLEPLDFISLAEETGLVVPLGRWVLQEACRQTMEWQVKHEPILRGTGMSLLVGVNLSGRQLSQRELVHDVSASLRASGLAPSHLVLEMTESMLVHDNRATLERLHALKSLGVRLSIDDFGTGYSSLAYLERFPVDSLKMDRSFITGLSSPQSKAPLAEAVIGLGRILGLRVVAEGIESREQWERLRILGCGLGQGFHISPPVPASEFDRLIVSSATASKGLASGRFPIGIEEARRTSLTGLVAIT